MWEQPGLYGAVAVLENDPRTRQYGGDPVGLPFEPSDGQPWDSHYLNSVTLRQGPERSAHLTAQRHPPLIELRMPRDTQDDEARTFGSHFLQMTSGTPHLLEALMANRTEILQTDGEGGSYRNAPAVAVGFSVSVRPLRLEDLARELGLIPPPHQAALASVESWNWTFTMPQRVRSLSIETSEGLLFVAPRASGQVVASLHPISEGASFDAAYTRALTELAVPIPLRYSNHTWQRFC